MLTQQQKEKTNINYERFSDLMVIVLEILLVCVYLRYNSLLSANLKEPVGWQFKCLVRAKGKNQFNHFGNRQKETKSSCFKKGVCGPSQFHSEARGSLCRLKGHRFNSCQRMYLRGNQSDVSLLLSYPFPSNLSKNLHTQKISLDEDF